MTIQKIKEGKVNGCLRNKTSDDVATVYQEFYKYCGKKGYNMGDKLFAMINNFVAYEMECEEKC